MTSNKRISIECIGLTCKQYRQALHVKQSDVAADLCVDQSIVSKFESGKLDSAYVLWWYVRKGLSLRKTRIDSDEAK